VLLTDILAKTSSYIQKIEYCFDGRLMHKYEIGLHI